MSQSSDFFLVILPGIALKMNNTCVLLKTDMEIERSKRFAG